MPDSRAVSTSQYQSDTARPEGADSMVLILKAFNKDCYPIAFNSMGTIEGISGARILQPIFKNDFFSCYIYDFCCKIHYFTAAIISADISVASITCNIDKLIKLISQLKEINGYKSTGNQL